VTTPAQGQPADTVPAGTDTPTTTQTTTDTPYANYLNELPEEVRPLVEPAFKKWDSDVTQRFQGLHSEYDPYKQLIDAYEPDALQEAVNLIESMNSNPQAFLKWFTEAAGITPEQGTTATSPQQQQQQDPNDADPYQQEIASLKQQLEQITGLIQGQQQQTQQQQQVAQLEGILSDLHTRHGNFDDVYVLTMIGNGMAPEAAVTQFKNTLSQFGVDANSTAPTVTSAANGGHAVDQISAADLASGKVSSKDIVAQMLKAANES
jgi:hypothetical protein